ncbi:MAG: sugar ABC transporter ATP-binding protein [Phycisphaerales bacterium]|nr:sugar ABC transporter ATP-binding protein [Phycisphaerales bacterium]
MLEVRNLTVDFPGVRALDRVGLSFKPGEIHAVIGENGAGKSTLMKVLSGVTEPTQGEVLLHGRAVRFSQPQDAIRAGVSMVHQELHLVDALSVAENIFLGRESTRGWFGIRLDRAKMHARAQELLNLLGAEIDPRREARDLSIAEAQFVEIAKCLASDARVLIFDEPTAVLGERDAARLLALLKRLRDEKRAIIFISHHLEEVVDIANRVSVLRDGKFVAEFERYDGVLRCKDGKPSRESALAQAMVGRALGDLYPTRAVQTRGAPRISIEEFGAMGRSAGINLAVAPGEIVGIAGLVGSGRTETMEAIVGLRKSVGRVRIDGTVVRFRSPREAMRSGVAYVSEDRKGRGLHVSLSSIVNCTLPTLDRFVTLGGARIASERERTTTTKWIDELGIRCARPTAPISSLSGGNQQKFAIARWLEATPRVLIVDEPTRGVDVGAKAEIYRVLAQLAAQGMAFIVVSSELPELRGLCDRVVVLRNGRLVGELSRDRLHLPDAEERLIRLASGLTAMKEGVQ